MTVHSSKIPTDFPSQCLSGLPQVCLAALRWLKADTHHSDSQRLTATHSDSQRLTATIDAMCCTSSTRSPGCLKRQLVPLPRAPRCPEEMVSKKDGKRSLQNFASSGIGHARDDSMATNSGSVWDLVRDVLSWVHQTSTAGALVAFLQLELGTNTPGLAPLENWRKRGDSNS